MANKDYFDRIADALEIIAGDDSHIDDIDKNMDYYKRIAEALENIAESGGSGDGGSGGGDTMVIYISYDEDGDSYSADKQFDEIYEAIQNGQFVVAIYLDNSQDPEDFYARYYYLNHAELSYIEFCSLSFIKGNNIYILDNLILAITPEGVSRTEINKEFSDNN